MASVLSPITVSIKVQPDHCKTFPDPNGRGRKRIIAQVSVDEISKAAITFGPNPRNQSMDTKVAQAIREGLKTEPGWFMYYNRGIVLNAHEAEYDNVKNELRLSFLKNEVSPIESTFGNLDGGHTNKVIMDMLQSGDWINPTAAGDRQHVTLEVLTGIDPQKLADLVGARNTNMSVKDLSLLILSDDLNWFTDILKDKGVYGQINWRQFDLSGDVNGQDVIATLSLLNPKLESKIRCYNGPGKMISDLKTDKRPDGLMAGLKSIRDVAFEYLKFVDYIHSRFEDWYNEAEGRANLYDEATEEKKPKKKSGFGNVAGIMTGSTTLVFLKKTIRYKVLKSWLLPLAYSFTKMVLSERENPSVWYTIADKVGPKLYQTLRLQTVDANYNLDKVGKSGVVWEAMSAHVWAEYMTHCLASKGGRTK